MVPPALTPPRPVRALAPHFAHAARLARHAAAVAAVPGILLSGCGDGSPAEHPVPGLSSLAPTNLEAGASERVLTATGADFVRASVLHVDGSPRPTQYVSATVLRATLTAADVAVPRMHTVTVVSPAPGGGASNELPYYVGPRTNPVPAVSGVAPAFVAAGSAATAVTVAGANFVAESRVVVGEAALPTTFVSNTELRATLPDTLLASARVLQLAVRTPWPGGGTTAPRAFEVRAAAPALTALSATQVTTGQPGHTLRVTGTGFVRNSAVRFSGAPRPTTFVSATALDVALDEGDLRAAGAFEITVVTPGPGGGTSNALTLTLVNGAPVVTLLPATGASAGRPGFTLWVHGRGFVQGSVVRWNGADLPTQYVSGTRVTATVGSADVAAPGAARVEVVNPAPGGGASAPVTLTVRAIAAPTVTASRVLKLHGRDVVYDAGTARLYVSVRGNAPLNGNSVVAVNPETGEVTNSVFVGSEPGRLARSDNGQYLYVGLNGANAVRRVTVAGLAPGLQWSLPAGQVAGDLEVAPGRPGTVAVSRHNPGSSPPLAGVSVYDDGAARPRSSDGHTGGNRIVFLDDPAVLYGYNNAHTGFEFFTIAVDADGARHVNAAGGLIAGFYTDIEGAAGRVYSSSGHVVDAGRRARVGTLGGGGSALAVDPATGRAFFVADGGIAVYDLNTFQLLGTIPLSGVALDHPALAGTRLVRWGTDGLAFLDQDELFLVRSPLVAP